MNNYIIMVDISKILHKEGEMELADGVNANAMVPVGNALPHWNISYYYDNPAASGAFGNSFFLFAIIL